MKPKIQSIQIRVETNEGITSDTWKPGKRFAKQMNCSDDPVKWFEDLLAQCKEHYEELMGG